MNIHTRHRNTLHHFLNYPLFRESDAMNFYGSCLSMFYRVVQQLPFLFGLIRTKIALPSALISVNRHVLWSNNIYSSVKNISAFSLSSKSVFACYVGNLVSTTERARIAKLGNPLKDGERRICGMLPLLVLWCWLERQWSQITVFISAGLNLCRMLGDKFLKEQDPRFSKEPYVSPVVQISKSCSAFALIAR